MSQKISDLKEKVKACETALAKLNEQRQALLGNEQDLQSQRRMACRDLAQGDSKQLKVIATLDDKLRPIQEAKEGFGVLISEAEKALAAGRDALQAAIDAEQQALSEFLKKKNEEYRTSVKSSVKQLVQDILEALAAAEVKLGELNVASTEIGGWPGDALFGLHKSFVNFIEGSNLRQLLASGYPGTISLWPMIENTPDIVARYGGKGPLAVKLICDVRAEKRSASWTEEFQKGVNHADDR